MSKIPVRRTLAARALLGALSAFGCMPQVKVTPIADRTYQVECEQALATCLVRVQEMCSAHGYDVLTASERRETAGPTPVQSEFVKTSATVRCRQAVPVFGTDPNPPPPPIATVAPAIAPPLPPAPSSAPLPPAAPSSVPVPVPAAAPGPAPVPAPSSAAVPAPSSAPPPSDPKPTL